MKRYWMLIIACLCSFSVLMADECEDYMKDADNAFYKEKNYEKALYYYKKIKSSENCSNYKVDGKIRQCQQALNPTPKKTAPVVETTLTASSSSVSFPASGGDQYVSITTNKGNWKINSNPASWCQIVSSNSGVTFRASANPNTYSRSTTMQVASQDGQKTLTVSISQAAKQQAPPAAPAASSSSGSSSSSTTNTYLTLDKTEFSISSYGSTEYINVSSNAAWEIQYPSGSKYSASRVGNQVKLVVYQNTTGSSREDYFFVKTTDGSKSVKVHFSQYANTSSSSSSSSSYNTSSSKSYSSYHYDPGYEALDDYNIDHGDFEVDWFSMRMNLCTGIEFEMGAFGLRYSVFKFEPAIFGWKYDFINDASAFYYQPDIKFIFPWSSEWAFQFGAGLSVNINLDNSDYSGSSSYYDYNYYDYYNYGYYGGYYYGPKRQAKAFSSSSEAFPTVWFSAELGFLYHWGEICSSDFFLRYDGMFVIGVSLNIGTGFL